MSDNDMKRDVLVLEIQQPSMTVTVLRHFDAANDEPTLRFYVNIEIDVATVLLFETAMGEVAELVNFVVHRVDAMKSITT